MLSENDIPIENRKYIYNNKNLFVSLKYIQEVLRKGQITEKIGDKSLYQTAFIHESYSLLKTNKELQEGYNFKHCTDEITLDEQCTVRPQKTSYEDLEWLGDGVMKGIMTTYLWDRFGKEGKSFLHDMRTKLENRETFSKMAKCLNFPRNMIVSKYQDVYCCIRKQDKALCDVFEAFIGALWMDFFRRFGEFRAYEVTKQFVINIIEKYVDMVELINKEINYKRDLKEWFQKNHKIANIEYRELECMDDTKTKTWCVIDPLNADVILAEGTSRTNASAKETAAMNALIKLGILDKIGKKKQRIKVIEK